MWGGQISKVGSYMGTGRAKAPSTLLKKGTAKFYGIAYLNSKVVQMISWRVLSADLRKISHSHDSSTDVRFRLHLITVGLLVMF